MAKSDDKHRYIWCRDRDKCLNVAALARWDGMSCFYCPTNPRRKKKSELDFYEGIDHDR